MNNLTIEIDIEHNPLIKTDDDRKNIEFLLDLFKKYPRHFNILLTSRKSANKYIEINKWINEKTPLLNLGDFNYNVCTKLNWIFSGRTDWKICENPNCGNPIGKGRDNKVMAPYGKHCCRHCSKTDPEEQKKSKQTRKERYGDENYVNITKCKLTKKERYGDENYQNMEAVYETKRQRYGDPFYNNREKSKETVKRHAEEDPLYFKKIDAKNKATRKERYGCETYVNVEKQLESWNAHKESDPNFISDRQKRIQETCLKNNDFISPFEVEKYRDKAKKTMLEHHGVECSFLSEELREKAKQTNIRKTGYDNVFKDPAFRKRCDEIKLERYGTIFGRTKANYEYDGRLFDTSWELIYYIYLKQEGIEFEYHPVKYFTFVCHGKESKYYPDFILKDGTIVEIKGDQFFDEDGNLRCIYRDKDWTDEDVAYNNEIYRAKQKCMEDNKVKIIRGADIGKISKILDERLGVSVKKMIRQYKKSSKNC